MEDFIKNLPKIELHAHLNGSLPNKCIKDLGEALYGGNTEEFLNLAEKLTDFEGSIDLSKCFEKFKFVHDLTATRKGLQLATEYVIREFAQDHTVYLELRTTPKETENISRKDYLECVLETIVACQEKYEIMVKLIPSIDRSKPLSQAETTINLILELKEKYKDLIVGVDLSGNPFLGKFEEFIPLLKMVRDNGLPLTLHCAEVENKKEIDEMVDFGMDRCGHGTFLNEEHLKLFATRRIAIECCLTSNMKCKTVSSYSDHHFQRIFNSGEPVVLCTDDSGIFDTTLTKEFLIAQRIYKLNKKDIFKLTLNALQFCFANDKDKKILLDKVIPYFSEVEND